MYSFCLLVSVLSCVFSGMFNFAFLIGVGVIPLIFGPFMSSWILVDTISEMFVVLSVVVFGGVLFLMSWNFSEKLLLVGCLLCFSLNSVIFFIVVFEFILLPISAKIWMGKSGERFSASSFLLVYTIVFSFPLFAWLVFINISGSLGGMMLSFLELELGVFCFLVFVVFCVNFPVFLFHVWLPKAHVEAPTVGSIILAACLLKLGSYGLIRFILLFCPPQWVCHFFSIGIVGSLLASLCCIIQWDLKSLIAFSSISHMTFLLCSLFSKSGLSMDSFIFVSLSHGVGSSLLFFVFGLLYDSLGSRSVLICRGSTYLSSFLENFICFICFFNVGFPFLVSFFGEFFVVSSLLTFFSSWIILVVGLIVLLNSVYTYFLNFSLQGENVFSKFSSFGFEFETSSALILFWLGWGFVFLVLFQYGS